MKLAAAPSGPITITITSPTDFITNKTSLVFNALNFSTNQSGNVNGNAATVNSFPVVPTKLLYKNLNP